jgi:pimeloyl-ACP methyl ester carboxylesterase
MSHWQSSFIESNGMKLHYTRTGGDKPPLLLAHGFSDDGLCWTPVADRLAADYDIVMVDARGHGRSTGPESGYGNDDHAADLAGVIAGLGLKRPPVLGHSMGALTTIVLASRYPDLVSAALLEDPPAFWVEPAPAAPNADWQKQMRMWITELKRKLPDELIAEQRAASPGWSEAELRPWAESKLRLSFNVLNRADAPWPDWRALVQGITCPTLLITADVELGGLVGPEAADQFRALLPHVQMAHLPGAGHSIHREQFEPYMEAVTRFLAQHAGR